MNIVLENRPTYALSKIAIFHTMQMKVIDFDHIIAEYIT